MQVDQKKFGERSRTQAGSRMRHLKNLTEQGHYAFQSEQMLVHALVPVFRQHCAFENVHQPEAAKKSII